MNEKEINMAFDKEYEKLYATGSSYAFQIIPEQSDWQCYMFGNRPGSAGIVYRPTKGRVPNLFVRWMTRICFDCLWIKDKA